MFRRLGLVAVFAAGNKPEAAKHLPSGPAEVDGGAQQAGGQELQNKDENPRVDVKQDYWESRHNGSHFQLAFRITLYT